MANVIHRTTLEWRPSVNTPDYVAPTNPPDINPADWKVDPDMSGVGTIDGEGVLTITVPWRYWKAPANWDAAGAGPVEMTQPEKDARDAQLLDDAREAVAASMDRTEDIIRALARTLLDELNLHADKINEMRAAAVAATSLADYQSRMTAITDYPQRTIGQLRTSVRNKLGT